MLPPHHFYTPVSDLVQLGNSQTVQPTRAYTQTRWKISVSCWEVYSWTANFPIYWRHSFKSVSIGLSNLHRTFWRRQSRAIFSRYRHLQPTTSILTRTSHPHRLFFFKFYLSFIYTIIPSPFNAFKEMVGLEGYPVFSSIVQCRHDCTDDVGRRHTERRRVFMYWSDWQKWQLFSASCYLVGCSLQ